MMINLTPHTICVVDADNNVIREYPSKGVARVASMAERIGSVDGIDVVRTSFGEIVGLPGPDDENIYIVSMVVAQVVPQRTDIVAPDTGPTAYRVEGKVVGVRQFARY